MDSNRKIRLSDISLVTFVTGDNVSSASLYKHLCPFLQKPPAFYFTNARTLELLNQSILLQNCCIQSASDVKTHLPQLEIKQLCGRRNSLLNICNLIPRAEWNGYILVINHQAGRQILFNSMEKEGKNILSRVHTFENSSAVQW